MTEGLVANTSTALAYFSYSWTVELYEFNLNVSNLFYFRLNDTSGSFSSIYFKIANNRSGLATAAASSVITTSTTQSSSSPSPAFANRRSIETLGIALGLGIPLVLAIIILVALFVLLKRKKTIPDPNPTQRLVEVPGDFLHRAEVSGDRFFELPATPLPDTGCS